MGAKRIIYIFLFLILTSCSASWHIRKAQRKDPALFATKTIIHVDTFIVEVPRVDTLFKYKHDTVEFTIDSIQVKYYYQTVDSTVYLEIDCPDSEVVTKTVTKTETIIIKPSFKEKILSGWWLLVILAAIYFVTKMIRKFLLPL